VRGSSRHREAPTTGAVELAAISPGGGLVATIGDGRCRLWYLGGTFEDEDVSQLELGPEEAAFIAGLGRVVPTARAAKRLVNVYRVLRASEVGRRRLVDPAHGEYKIVLLLLSLVTGWPRLALVVLAKLDEATSGSWLDLLDGICAAGAAGDEVSVVRGPGRSDENLDIVRALRDLSKGAPAALDRYREWIPHVRRFSILTGVTALDATPAET